MTTSDQEIAKQRQYQAAMAGLVMDTRFGEFINALRADREKAIDNLTNGDVISSERATLACIGEIATYGSIIRIYDEFKARGAEIEAESGNK